MSLLASICLAFTLTQSGELPRKPFLGIQFQPNTTTVASAVAGGSAEGILKPGDQITSVNKKATTTLPELLAQVPTLESNKSYEVIVSRDGKPVTLTIKMKERPREVSPDYDVIYSHIVSNGKRIRTIITKPKKEGKFPVFFMMQGLGQFSMDYSLQGQSGPYIEFVRHFAKKDFVTIRVEKPGMGDAEGGPYVDTDFFTEGDVYLQALRDIKTKPYANADRVFLFGHSMGGTFGPWVVSQEPVFGFIPSSTLYKTWTEYWLENVRRQSDLDGSPRVEIDKFAKADAVIQPLVLVEDWSPDQLLEKFPQYKEYIDSYFAADKTKMMGRTLGFWRQLAKLNLPELWSKVNCKTLVLRGEFDWVSTDEDHFMIRDQLNRQNPGSATYERIPNSFHGFTFAKSNEDAKQNAGQPFNPAVITVMDNWITAQLEQNSK
ncbi:MAG: serine aminopeptidase domain-containing protein [Fimbriimonadaceae bacterium]